jgi:acetyl esterase
MNKVVLEPAAQGIADATANPPFLYELGPEGARKVLDDLQAAPVDKVEVGEDKWITVPAEVGDVQARIIKPLGATGSLPVILYVHGGGWILGNSGTHDRLIRELAAGANAALVFVEYDRSPEVKYPHAIEQAYATAQWITQHGHTDGLDATRMAVAGDSVGGNMAAALTLLAKQRGDVHFVHQSMYYPVTDAAQDTESYRTFADGPFLLAKSMAWFWDAYLPDASRRSEIKRLTAPGDPQRPRRPSPSPRDRRSERRPPRRGRGVRGATRRGGRTDHKHPVQLRHPRPHDAQPRAGDPGSHCGSGAGHPCPEEGVHEPVGMSSGPVSGRTAFEIV